MSVFVYLTDNSVTLSSSCSYPQSFDSYLQIQCVATVSKKKERSVTVDRFM